jgi:hypothetical protein
MRGPIDRVEPSTDSNTPPSRSFLDTEGAHWLVYEQAFADCDRRSGMSLIFSNESAVRRVRDYPAGWSDLSDEDLAVLSWKS